MKKLFHIALCIMVCTLLYACQTISQYSFEYLTPAKISFPTDVRKVGIINNAPDFSQQAPQYLIKDSLNLRTGIWAESYYLHGLSEMTVNAFAEALAAESYFDKVTISETLVREDGREGAFSGEEIVQLTNDLDADMLISLEYFPLKSTHHIVPTEGVFRAGTNITVYPLFRLYIPSRKTALNTIQLTDSIQWEEYYLTYENAQRGLIPDVVALEEASFFAADVATTYLVPTWTSTARFYYPSGSSLMRDAAYFANNGEWAKALPLWEKAYHETTGRKQGRAASNLSLYYEINNDLEKADEWNKRALEIFKTVDKVNDEALKIPTQIENDYTRAQVNQLYLQKRREDFLALKLQMNRFDEE